MSPRVQVHAADEGGCGHYRLIWPGEAAIAAGADVELVLPDSPAAAITCNLSLEALARGHRRPGSIKVLPETDVIVLQRPLTEQLVHVIRGLQSAGIAVIVEVDDDFSAIDPLNVAWPAVQPRLSPRRNFRHLEVACQLADLVTVTTPALAARYGRHGRVRIIPNHVPRRYLYLERRLEADRLRVGWSGSIDTHPHDLQVTRGAVARTLDAHDLTFHLIGSGRVPAVDELGRPQVDEHGAPVQVTDYRVVRNLHLADGTTFAHTGGWLHLEQYPHAIAELDIGIVPLAPSVFNEAKSWLKGLEYAALGVPFIASPTGPYRALHALGAGRLAERPRQWEAELRRLITSATAREELAADGRDVAARHTIEGNVEQWVDAWHSAAELAARRRPRPTAAPRTASLHNIPL